MRWEYGMIIFLVLSSHLLHCIQPFQLFTHKQCVQPERITIWKMVKCFWSGKFLPYLILFPHQSKDAFWSTWLEKCLILIVTEMKIKIKQRHCRKWLGVGMVYFGVSVRYVSTLMSHEHSKLTKHSDGLKQT